MHNIFVYQWAMVLIPFISLVAWLLYELGSHVTFHSFMAQNNCPLLRKTPYLSINGIFSAIRRSRFIGTAWFIRRLHGFLVILAVMIIMLAFLRALYSGHSLEFSRAGALVVISGLVSILIGFLESRKTRQVWEQFVANVQNLEHMETLQEIMASPIEHAQFVAAKVSIAVSILGTIVWAYGDQLLACGIFPVLSIVDNSGVVCMQ